MDASLQGYGTMIGNALGQSWQHMTVLLFHKFTIRRWLLFAVGAWMASLGGFSNVNFDPSWTNQSEGVNSWIRAHAVLVLAVVAALLVIGLVVALVALWVRSRGSFVFLDSVARDAPQIAQPWTTYARLGNSLFWWRLLFGICVFVGIVVLVAVGVGGGFLLQRQPIALAIGITIAVCAGITVLVVTGVIMSFLNHFVVPLMYRYGMPCTAAWGYFLTLCRAHATAFLLFLVVNVGLRMLAAGIIGSITVAIMLMTCCVGALILAIPLLGSFITITLMLPIHVYFRCFGVFFLQQFHPDYQMMVTPESAPGQPPVKATS